MSVTITIEDDGHIEAQHNSGHILWGFDVDPDDLPHDYAADEQLANGVESFFGYLMPYANPEDFDGGEPGDAQ